MSGQKIIDGLREAIKGDFHRVTIDGQVWMKATDVNNDMQEIMRINNAMRDLLNEAMNSRAPDLVDAAHPGWTDRVRSMVKP